MLDLFGKESDVVKKSNSVYLDAKRRIKYIVGDSEHNCKLCKIRETFEYHNKNYHKCKYIGYSHSSASDIRLKNVCMYFNRGNI